MTIVLYILVGLFTLKILWNLTVPYELAFRRSKMAGQKSGVSLMPYLEIAVLLLAIATAFFSGGRGWFHSPKNIAILGGLAVVASYIHLVAAGMIVGWILSLRKKGR